MSFLFKSKKPNVNGATARSLTSADGSVTPNGSGFGSPNEPDRARPVPNGTPASSINSVSKSVQPASIEGGSLRGRNDAITPVDDCVLGPSNTLEADTPFDRSIALHRRDRAIFRCTLGHNNG